MHFSQIIKQLEQATYRNQREFMQRFLFHIAAMNRAIQQSNAEAEDKLAALHWSNELMIRLMTLLRKPNRQLATHFGQLIREHAQKHPLLRDYLAAGLLKIWEKATSPVAR